MDVAGPFALNLLFQPPTTQFLSNAVDLQANLPSGVAL